MANGDVRGEDFFRIFTIKCWFFKYTVMYSRSFLEGSWMTRGQRMARRFCIQNVLIIEPNHQCLDSRLMLRWIMNLPETRILKTCLVKNVQGKACDIIPKIKIIFLQKKKLKLTTSPDSPDLFLPWNKFPLKNSRPLLGSPNKSLLSTFASSFATFTWS